MADRLPRRSLVGTIGVLASAGCLDARPADDDSSANESTDASTGQTDDATDASAGDATSEAEPPARCTFSPAAEWGRGERVERTIPTSKDDSIDQCIEDATKVVTNETLRRTDLERYDSPPQWIQTVHSSPGDEEARIVVQVKAEKTGEFTGDGSYFVCPPKAYSFEALVAVAPKQVVIHVEPDVPVDTYTCEWRVRVEQVQSQVD